MRFALFLLPYLLAPVLLAVLSRVLKLERWRFMTYILCAGLLINWPTMWEDYHTTRPDPEPAVDNLFPTLAAVFFIHIALFVHWMANNLLARKGA